MKLSEKKLVSKLAVLLKKEFSTNQYFAELSVGYGRADLVFTPNYTFKKGQIKNRIPITDFVTLQIILALENDKSYELEDLYGEFNFLSKQHLRQQLQLLVCSGALEKISKNTFRKIDYTDQLNPIPEIIAIEAKLTDFKGGLIQARRYKYFADKVYLAILEEAKEKIDVRHFEHHNIGLIFFNATNNSIDIVHPHKENNLFEEKINLFAKELILKEFLH